jgi:hypothetical protein
VVADVLDGRQLLVHGERDLRLDGHVQRCDAAAGEA